MQAIGEWGVTWSFTDPRPEELDPDLLIVWMARHVDREQLPPDRTVVQFDFRDPAKRYWMVLEPSEVSVCLQHPGFDVDLEVTVDTATLYRVYLGRAELAGAIRARKLTMSGPKALPARVRTLVRLERVRPASRQAEKRDALRARRLLLVVISDEIRHERLYSPGNPTHCVAVHVHPAWGRLITQTAGTGRGPRPAPCRRRIPTRLQPVGRLVSRSQARSGAETGGQLAFDLGPHGCRSWRRQTVHLRDPQRLRRRTRRGLLSSSPRRTPPR